ncbi:putative transport protein YidE [Escherichia coli]|uniref:Putative transport protein YidE n=1 Tax=Escherichia coli TaxID=562 RepID=A0A2X1QE93_ECOLX|nr:putative transport protein YidE [Escherichia coli]
MGQPADLHNAQLVIGQEVDTSLSTKGTDLRVERVVVTNENVLGKRIRDLHFKERYDVVYLAPEPSGVELVASGDISLQFGDILNLVGRPSAIDAVANVLGNAQQKLQQVQMLPVFIGIGLGVLLGSIPVFVPGFPAALKLGLAGGPLIMALILGAYRQYRQAVLVYAAKRQPRAAGAGDRAVPLGRWSEIWWGFCEYPGQWRRAKLDWLWCPDHRRSADYCWHSGADVSQNELPDHVRDAGRFHDRSSGAGVC